MLGTAESQRIYKTKGMEALMLQGGIHKRTIDTVDIVNLFGQNSLFSMTFEKEDEVLLKSFLNYKKEMDNVSISYMGNQLTVISENFELMFLLAQL